MERARKAAVRAWLTPLPMSAVNETASSTASRPNSVVNLMTGFKATDEVSLKGSGRLLQRLGNQRISGASTRATTAVSLIRMLRLGPLVSLRGSPTVSPTTPALCASLPLP